MRVRIQIVACCVLLCAVVMLESWTSVDMDLQRLLYGERGWLVTRAMHNAGLGLWLYSGPKIGLALFGALCLLGVIRAVVCPAQRHWLRPCLFLALSLALIPLLVAGGKQVTNIYCPKELRPFGGERNYQQILAAAAPDNANAPRGKGFPAGHASGGFALMGLYFVGTTTRQRVLGLGAGLLAGWTMGLYQLARGEHFLSHTLFSMLLAWLVLLLLAKGLGQCGPGADAR